MGNGTYILPAPETVSMSGDAARRLIGCGSGDAALVYLYILESGGRFDISDAARRIGRSEAQIETALGVLRRLGLVNGGEVPQKKPERADELPQYTAEDIKRETENGSDFPKLVAEVQKALGRLLSSDDMLKLFGIYDYLGLPPEVILQLTHHCKDECARKNGPGRIPTMRYIEKAAYTWEREGIFSIEAAETYLKTLSERRTAYSDFSACMGIGNRALSATERKYIDAWTDMGFTSAAAAIAYDRTVTKTGKLTWSYMNSILVNWDKKGLHTPEEIKNGDFIRQPARREEPKPPQQGTTAMDMDRMRETLRKINGDD